MNFQNEEANCRPSHVSLTIKPSSPSSGRFPHLTNQEAVKFSRKRIYIDIRRFT